MFPARNSSAPAGTFSRVFVPSEKLEITKMAKRLEGKVFTVHIIDSASQIHLVETGLALIQGVDEYEIVN